MRCACAQTGWTEVALAWARLSLYCSGTLSARTSVGKGASPLHQGISHVGLLLGERTCHGQGSPNVLSRYRSKNDPHPVPWCMPAWFEPVHKYLRDSENEKLVRIRANARREAVGAATNTPVIDRREVSWEHDSIHACLGACAKASEWAHHV